MIKPTDSELEILAFLWQHGPSTVREVHNFFGQNQRRRLHDDAETHANHAGKKGLLSRTEEGRSHIYTAQVSEEETQQSLLGRFVETAFRGSAAQLVMQALGNHRTSAEELEEIRQLLDNLENNR